jgi:hypothetical protein
LIGSYEVAPGRRRRTLELSGECEDLPGEIGRCRFALYRCRFALHRCRFALYRCLSLSDGEDGCSSCNDGQH